MTLNYIKKIDNYKENTKKQTFPRNDYSATTLLASHTQRHIAVADQCRSNSTYCFASHENVKKKTANIKHIENIYRFICGKKK
jgi:hypothetical protein